MENEINRSLLLGERYVRQSEILHAFLPVSPATLWRMVNRGDFPRPIKLSSAITVWKLSDIQQWIQQNQGR